MAGNIDRVITQPWRMLKEKHFGGADVPLHASELDDPTREQLEALNKFFREQPFGRFATTMTVRTILPPGYTPYRFMPDAVRRRWQELASRHNPSPVEVAILHEASQRGDALVEHYFGETVVHADGKRVHVHHGLIAKKYGDEAIEVADFIVQASGQQAYRWMKGDSRLRLDFKSIFHANPAWSSFNATRSIEPSKS